MIFPQRFTAPALKLLIRLIQEIQRHRGMSTALLAGDASFALRQAMQATKVDELLNALKELQNQENIHFFNALDTLSAHWEELLDQQEGESVERSFARHTMLIAQLIPWIDRLMPASTLNRAEQHQRRVIDNFCFRLPNLSELLGQARALGSWVAATGGCSPMIRVRLIFLLARAETLFAEAENGDACPATSETMAGDIIHQVVKTIRTEMLANSGITMPPPRYFELTSRAIDAVFDWIEASGSDIENQGLNV